MHILVNILIFWKKLDPSSLCKAERGRHLLTCGLEISCVVSLDIGANLTGLFRYIRG
jgi:hypothetical protein